jgi:hypothetical protein
VLAGLDDDVEARRQTTTNVRVPQFRIERPACSNGSPDGSAIASAHGQTATVQRNVEHMTSSNRYELSPVSVR